MAVSRGIKRTPEWREMLKRSLIRSGALIGSIALLLATLFLALALLSYTPSDPSMNTVAGDQVRNVMQLPGAWTADFLLWLLGVPAALVLPLMAITARRLWGDQDMSEWKGQFGKCLTGIVLVGLALALFQPDPLVGLPAGWGGVIALVFARGIMSLSAQLPAFQGWAIGALVVLTLVAGLYVWYRSLALEKPILALRRPALPRLNLPRPAFALPGRVPADEDEEEDGAERVIAPRKTVTNEPKPPITIQSPKPAPSQRPVAPVSQDDLFGNSSLPSPDLLNPIPAGQGQKIDKAALERNARLLESVLDDFHVKGNIVEVRPGPVVTMYELEPAPGIKASRVIALADDIARNMSALSARVATIPGRTVIGIELPNANREGVSFRELITSEQFGQEATLPIILGKNISGEPIIADLAPMPHLLIAGTTGSGKSVGLNAMILSLLYKADASHTRVILIDPKMLEMSVYEGIPHLLAPVVTDMRQAANALNWCVGEMEKRYRLMSKMGVRNLAGYNTKIRDAAKREEPIPNPFSLTPDQPEPLGELPMIVVVIDELADLMMVVGKKIEELIARLAQKARAAGIHLILATQRPSVDVITGLIKANIPTRIAFQVSSKIDSRTILDQMGAEALLGQGDMLYMPPGTGLPVRVHGAFVADDEVHRVVEYLKSQGEPDYVDGLLEGGSEGETGDGLGSVTGFADTESDPMYDQAVEVVLKHRRASISLVQRHLRIGYNRAARLLEQMEQSGMVSAMQSNGNRDILVPSKEE